MPRSCILGVAPRRGSRGRRRVRGGGLLRSLPVRALAPGRAARGRRVVRRPHAVDDRRPLRRAGERPLRRRAVRAGDGRGTPFPLQPRRGAHHGRHQPAPHGGAGAGARRRARAARGSSPSRSCWARRSTWPRCRSRPASARRLAGPREGLLAGALVALAGPVVWGFLYGSDIALFLFLALLLLERWLAFCGRRAARAGFAVAGALLALARPEGLPLALALARCAEPGAARGRARAIALLAFCCRSPRGWPCSRCSASSRAPGSRRRSRTSRCCRTTGPSRRSPSRREYGVDVLRGLLLGLYPPEAAIGFSRGEASFFFPPLALVLVLLAVARPEGALARPRVCGSRSWPLVFALTGPERLHGRPLQSLPDVGVPGPPGVRRGGARRASRASLARDDARLERRPLPRRARPCAAARRPVDRPLRGGLRRARRRHLAARDRRGRASSATTCRAASRSPTPPPASST